jgi:HAD superfamily hydrolase (TIGR01509 family)
MQTPSSIRAVFFDLDGTLIDSESLTDRAVLYLLQKHALPANNLDLRLFHGTTWRAIALRLKALFPTLDDLDYTIELLSTHFFEQSMSAPPPLIPAAQEAFLAASSRFPTGIVTGSNADAVDHFLRHSGLESACSFVVSSEQYAASKPDPVCYQLAAEQLAIPPAQCLVFEDSTPGLQAAKAAGMPAIAVLYSAPPPPSGLAIGSIVDYTELPDTFFEQIGKST